MTSSMENDIRKLSDEDLLNLYEIKFMNYTDETLLIAKDELNKRNITKRIWHYNDGNYRHGPYSRDEIIDKCKRNEIKYNHKILCEAFEGWKIIKELDFLKKYYTNIIEDELDDRKEDNSETWARTSSILFIVEGVIWALIVLIQLFYSITTNDMEYSLLAGWNIVMTTISIVIGMSIWNLKKWAYKWGLRVSEISIVWYTISLLQNENNISIIFIIINIAIFILLRKGKSSFKIQEYEKEKGLLKM